MPLNWAREIAAERATNGMTALDSSAKKRRLDTAAVLARWFLGGIFIYMGLVKALDPVTFLKMVREYEMVGNPVVLNLIASVLPWFEVFCGVLLVAGVAVRGSALVLLGMLIPFTLIVLKRALAIASAEGILFCAVKFNCGCGGGDVYICQKLIENTGLMLLALLPLAGLGKKWALRFEMLLNKVRGEIGEAVTAV
jgi:uncharacterized membrane protein YphA (DoxX/SURF4 family)